MIIYFLKSSLYAEKTKHLSASKIRLESRLKDLEKHNETTRKDLENQIFDLTTTIGVTEKTRTKDQETVAQLRARIDVLDLENLNLLSKAKGNNELKVSELPKIMFDVCSRDIEVTNIFSTLLTQTRKAVNEEISLSAIANVFPEIRTQFDKKLQNLKDENLSLQREVKIFRENPLDSSASSLNTSVNNQDTTTILSKSLRESEDIIEQLKLANLNLTTKSEELENDLRNVKLTHRNQVSSLNLEFDNKIKDNNQNWRAKFASLDEELIAQRERSLKILNDKEKELQQLRTQVFSTTPPATPDNANMNPLDISVGTDRLSVDSTGLQGELADKMDESIYRINYTEKLARKDIELENLKKQNKEFSKRIRNLQDKILEIDDKHQAEITQYKDRIATAINPNNYNMSRKESSASIHSGVDINSVQTQNQNKSANSNEDYIKNVLFNYLILPQKNKARGHMLNALASALHFTNEELNRVKSTQKL